MEDSPLLDLFNISYEKGKLPSQGKVGLIHPIPKGNQDYRPITLTSCMCKMMERILMKRLLYKLDDLMSDNLFGFIKGKSTIDCVKRCLSHSNTNCRGFVDLMGAFDKANQDVILEELIVKGIKGRLLGWIGDNLIRRKAKVSFQGHEFVEKSFELGTPQGGILSPILFNVLMDRIGRHNFPHGTQVQIYADDILLQCSNERVMTEALEEFESLCLCMGMVINIAKTKFQSRRVTDRVFMFNGQRLERVTSYKYLGMCISFN